MLILSISSDIKYGVLDVLRGIGMGIVNIIFKTIDVLYKSAYKINSLNFIDMLKNINNSPFTKIFNAFFLLSFFLLFLFSVWKVTFKILDADSNEQPMFELVKEIIKCGFLIFSVYLIFNTTINLGISLSNAIYNNFNKNSRTIGDTMKSSYLSINEACYVDNDNDSVDSKNVDGLKDVLEDYCDVDDAETMEDFEDMIRDGDISATDVSDSGAFAYRCQIYKPGIWNDEEDYAFTYNFLFGIIIGGIFLFSIGFSVLMIGRRQLELAFLMVIAPLVIATSIGRKEQRRALYQQLASLVLQAGALMLLIGLTSIMFDVIQNSNDINKLGYFTKLVTQTVLYLGCAMMLMTGCTSLNRFIGENVSANSGRDMMIAMRGLGHGISSALGVGAGIASFGMDSTKGMYRTGRGLGQLAKGGFQTGQGIKNGMSSANYESNRKMSDKMNQKANKNMENIKKGNEYQKSNNPFIKTYGKFLQSHGEQRIRNLAKQWNFEDDSYNPEYMKDGINLAKTGVGNISSGIKDVIDSIKNIGNPNIRKYRVRSDIKNAKNEKENN